MLRGRDEQQAAIEASLEGARAGVSSAVVLRGEPGIGKTALLDYAHSQAAGMVVLRAAGIESEAELPFAGLHLLVKPVLGRLPRPRGHRHPARRAGTSCNGADTARPVTH